MENNYLQERIKDSDVKGCWVDDTGDLVVSLFKKDATTCFGDELILIRLPLVNTYKFDKNQKRLLKDFKASITDEEPKAAIVLPNDKTDS